MQRTHRFMILSAVLTIVLFAVVFSQARADTSDWQVVTKPSVVQPAAARPTVVVFLVNGNLDCCMFEATKLIDGLNALNGKDVDIRLNIVPWNSIHNQNEHGFDIGENMSRGTENFVRDVQEYVDTLPAGTGLVFVGHSFGGDSILSFLQAYRRTNHPILFAGVIDPVDGGGVRNTLRLKLVGYHVRYFYNRWQTNLPWPVDFLSSGSIPCSAGQCDQGANNYHRNWDGSHERVQCGELEVGCDGAKTFTKEKCWKIARKNVCYDIPGYDPGTKRKPVSHQSLPEDAYLQRQMLEIISSQIAAFAEEQRISHSEITATITNVQRIDNNCKADLLTAGDGFLYWRDQGTTKLQRGRVVEGQLISDGVIDSNWTATVMAAGGGFLFWKDPDPDTRLRRAELIVENGQVTFGPITVVDQDFRGEVLTADSSYIYWRDKGSTILYRASVKADRLIGANERVDGNSTAIQIATSSGYLIWKDNEPQTILRYGFTIRNGITNVQQIDINYRGKLLAADGRNLFWLDSPGTVLRMGSLPAAQSEAESFGNVPLYVIQSGGLHKVNPSNGTYFRFDGDWSGPVAMITYGDLLYVIQNGRLHRVNPADGSYYAFDGDWSGNEIILAAFR